MYNIEEINIKRIAQVGIVCSNAKQSMDNFCNLFNVPENRQMLIEVKEGENSNFSAIFGWVNYGGLQFEFIEPLGGDDKTYSNFLEKTGGGLHHIMFSADNSDKILNEFREAGILEVTPGSYNGKVYNPSVGYFDLTKEMGLIFEIQGKDVDAITTLDFDHLFKR